MVHKRIFRTPEAASYLGLAASTLEKMRLRGTGPEFVRLGGRAIGYDLAMLDAWIERQRRTSTSDSGGTPSNRGKNGDRAGTSSGKEDDPGR